MPIRRVRVDVDPEADRWLSAPPRTATVISATIRAGRMIGTKHERRFLISM
jgi:hypothetical protein